MINHRNSWKCWTALCAGTLAMTCAAGTANASATRAQPPVRAAAKPGTVKYVMVIDLENEGESTTFGPNSPATYLNTTLLPQGEFIQNYFATGHVSLDNYIAQVSGQGSNPTTNDDCLDLSTLRTGLKGGFNNVLPGTDSSLPGQPGQVVGQGCVYPAPTATTRGAQTIGDQLDARYPGNVDLTGKDRFHNWRAYVEDMGNDPVRDGGDTDALGGTDCAHPVLNGVDTTNSAEAQDQFATRHNGFVYFHSVIDNQARCDSHVVPLGKVTVGQNGAADTFTGHLFNDLRRRNTTPHFMWVTPNLCNDGHDATCQGTNIEGGTTGGLTAADLWLKHYMPMIFASPAYQSGEMLVVVTFDEAGFNDSRACPAVDQSTCNSPTGPNTTNPGYSPVLGIFGAQTAPTAPYTYAGGGQVGAVVFHKTLIKPGSVNSTGVYNHFSALRSYEDLLLLHTGGDDGLGHLGYAATQGMLPFGTDVFNNSVQP